MARPNAHQRTDVPGAALGSLSVGGAVRERLRLSEEQYRSRVVAKLKRRAKSLGFVLQAVPCDAEMVVS